MIKFLLNQKEYQQNKIVFEYLDKKLKNSLNDSREPIISLLFKNHMILPYYFLVDKIYSGE